MTEGADRTVFRLWDPMTLRRVVSGLVMFFQDMCRSIMDGLTDVRRILCVICDKRLIGIIF